MSLISKSYLMLSNGFISTLWFCCKWVAFHQNSSLIYRTVTVEFLDTIYCFCWWKPTLQEFFLCFVVLFSGIKKLMLVILSLTQSYSWQGDHDLFITEHTKTYHPSYIITHILTMWRSRKNQLSLNVKIFLVMTKIKEVGLIFVLGYQVFEAVSALRSQSWGIGINEQQQYHEAYNQKS